MRLYTRAVAVVALLAFTVTATVAAQAGAWLPTDLDACDRNYDQTISISDARVALQAAVSPCLKESYCDADGDGSESVTDALAILRYAVALPVTLECTCIAIDECFDDGDCQGPGYPPGLFCLPYRCVECEFDTDCADGFVCDGCTYTCYDAAGAAVSMSLR